MGYLQTNLQRAVQQDPKGKRDNIHSKSPYKLRESALNLSLTCNFPTRRKVRRKKSRMEGRVRIRLTRSSMVATFVFQLGDWWYFKKKFHLLHIDPAHFGEYC